MPVSIIKYPNKLPKETGISIRQAFKEKVWQTSARDCIQLILLWGKWMNWICMSQRLMHASLEDVVTRKNFHCQQNHTSVLWWGTHFSSVQQELSQKAKKQQSGQFLDIPFQLYCLVLLQSMTRHKRRQQRAI